MFNEKPDNNIDNDCYSLKENETCDQPPQESNYLTTSQRILNNDTEDTLNDITHLNISIIGLGYVGSVSCACFSSLGHRVIGVDPDVEKVKSISQGNSPIVEPQLDSLLTRAHNNGKLDATADIEFAVLATDITLVSVGTPSKPDGGCDLRYLTAATVEIGNALTKKDSYHVIVFRSTVPPTTTTNILIPLLEKTTGKKCGRDFGVCFNPEFLRESTAIDDFYHPPKTVIGAFDKKSLNFASRLYQDIEGGVIETSLEAAEFVKYIDNTWHALKVSFGNEVGRICKAMDVDSHEVMNIFVKDTKLNISPYYLMPGFAFGGSCLPKDTRGIVSMADELNVDIPIIEHINQSNGFHINHTLGLIDSLAVSTIGIVGLTFKSDTDDLRESPSIKLLINLLDKGYNVQFYDPSITTDKLLDTDPELNKKLNLSRCNSITELETNAQALVITHNKKYSQDIINIANKDKPIIDVIHLPEHMVANKNYHGLCW